MVAGRFLQTSIPAANAENAAYDAQSNHGVSEGANINTAVQCAPEKVQSMNDPAPEDQTRLADAQPPGDGVLQAKLAIGAPDDPFEREADAMADRVTRQEPARPLARATRSAVRRCAGPGPCDCDDCAAKHALAHTANSTVERVVRDGGVPLGADTRLVMESRFGHDFSRVRVHDDQEAAASAAAIQARAYAFGSHVAFAAGQYAPHTDAGMHLLAHELTHVVQQGHAAPSPA